jgi:hypothetical protein
MVLESKMRDVHAATVPRLDTIMVVVLAYSGYGVRVLKSNDYDVRE